MHNLFSSKVYLVHYNYNEDGVIKMLVINIACQGDA